MQNADHVRFEPKVEWTFKKIPIQNFGSLQPKNFTEILQFFRSNAIGYVEYATISMPNEIEKWLSVFELLAKNDFQKQISQKLHQLMKMY